MQVEVNGESKDLSPGTTIQVLLADLGLDRDGIAVAVNRRVVPRSRHPETELEEGAVVEIIRAVGGG